MLIKETSITDSATDPWLLYLYAIKSPATKEKYVLRLRKFLDFANHEGTNTLEANARAFAEDGKNNPGWAFGCIIGFVVQKILTSVTSFIIIWLP